MIVIHLDAENDGAHGGGEQIAQKEGPVAGEYAVDGKEEATQAHEQECAGGNVIGFTGANGVEHLRQVAEHHADAGGITHDFGDMLLDKVKHNSNYDY